ncbi:hypothetical protein BDV97DRAFT_400367 [Delphinella strobiligena]|nr:hypothetical protein BDV97DRAFT_400367 [Delphinella strobiligena]
MSEIDLTLPSRVPEISHYHTIPTKLNPFAIYNLSPSTDLQNILEATNSLCPRSCISAAPSAFPNDSLSSIIKHHLTLPSDQFDPRYFLAVTSEDWREEGILVVTLDDDELECRPDAFRVKAQDAGLLLLNLQVGNTDWGEAKENYEIRGGGQGGDAAVTDATFPDGALRKKPGSGFYIAFYATPGLEIDVAELIRTIQPAHDKQPESEYICRFEGYLTEDPTQQATTPHQRQCKQNPYLHKSMFFLVDDEDYKERGLLLCHVDGKKKRVGCDVHTLVPEFCGIARGQRGWDE